MTEAGTVRTTYAGLTPSQPEVTSAGPAAGSPRVRAQVSELRALLDGRPLAVLTGAGVSTDSGIPDYRGPGKAPRTPMTYQELVSGPAAQRRYWARAHVGWRLMGHAEPNAGHRALVALRDAGRLTGLVTQNVDGLHEAAGHADAIALHGRISEVVCLDCRDVSSRAEMQQRLDDANPVVAASVATRAWIRPDGDAEVPEEVVSSYVVPPCRRCGGRLKPHVVFFGENVPRDRVDASYAVVDAAGDAGGALLVAGSSLTVMSGLRFVRHARRRGIDVAIVNRGVTRGDDLATVRVDAGTSEVLTALARPARPSP